MLNLPFDTVNLGTGEADTLEHTYHALNAKFNVTIDCGVIDITRFDFLNFDSDTTIGGTLKISTNECYLLFLKNHCVSHSSRGGQTIDYYKYRVWAFIKLKKDFGRLLIRRETFADKIISLIHPVELEFEDDKPFSKKFYVVANDNDKATSSLNFNFRNAIMDITDERIEIEIVGDTMIIGNHCWLDADETVYLAEVATKFAALR